MLLLLGTVFKTMVQSLQISLLLLQTLLQYLLCLCMLLQSSLHNFLQINRFALLIFCLSGPATDITCLEIVMTLDS